jgi:hypothetical protein
MQLVHDLDLYLDGNWYVGTWWLDNDRVWVRSWDGASECEPLGVVCDHPELLAKHALRHLAWRGQTSPNARLQTPA